MSTFLRKLVMWLVIALLPLQGAVAAGMPLYAGDTQAQEHACSMAHADHQTQDGHHDHGQPVQKLPCGNCTLCHICGTPALEGMFHHLFLAATMRFTPPAVTPFTSFVPEQPQRPPLSSLV